MITVPTWRPSRGIAALFVSILHFCILYVALDRIGAIQIDNSGAPNRGETADGALALAWIDLEDRDASNPQNPLTDNMRPLKHAEQIDGDRKLSQLGDGREQDEAENSTVISVEVTDRIDAWNLFTEDLRVRLEKEWLDTSLNAAAWYRGCSIALRPRAERPGLYVDVDFGFCSPEDLRTELLAIVLRELPLELPRDLLPHADGRVLYLSVQAGDPELFAAPQ